MTSGYAFLLVLVGLLGIYSEFVWPGRVLPGVGGCLLTSAGGYFLWQKSPTVIGLALIGTAVAFFIAEAFLPVNLIAGILGIATLSWGFCVLTGGARRIPAALAVPSSVVFGWITVVLLNVAKRARRNKWSDINCERSKNAKSAGTLRV